MSQRACCALLTWSSRWKRTAMVNTTARITDLEVVEKFKEIEPLY